jgi:WhiB family redox-sensing transcriptional regulator
MPIKFPRPLPPKGSMEWQYEAACRFIDTALFAEVGKRQSRGDEARVGRAMTICRGCPVRAECLEFGVTNRESGVYGGQHLIRGQLAPLHCQLVA